MPEWLGTLVLIFALILIVNSIGSFLMWKVTKNILFKFAAIAWIANFINFGIHGIVQEKAYLTLLGHGFYFITSCCLAMILCESEEYKYNLKKYFYMGISMLGLSQCTFLFFKSYLFSALIIDIFIAIPMIWASIRALKNKTSDVIIKIYSVLLMVNAFHFLDYPFLHDSPKGSVFGFSFAFILCFLISILLPNLILQLKAKKYTLRLEATIAERTANLIHKTQELEESNKDKNTLLSIVCHDISTPVMIINYNLSKFKKNIEQFSDTQKDQIIKLDQNISIISDILKLVKNFHASKLGKFEIKIVPVEIEVVLEEAVEYFKPLCIFKNIQIEFNKKVSRKNIILLDVALFKNQVLGNLISNAIKFSESGQKIQIILEELENFVQISVVDFGVGIPNEKISILFDLNVNTSTKGTHLELGSGLGLPTVKAVIEKLSGHIEVISNVSKENLDNTFPNRGTSFVIKFPYYHASN